MRVKSGQTIAAFGESDGNYDRPAVTSLFRHACSARLVDFPFPRWKTPSA
jgi:hypothetical protein